MLAPASPSAARLLRTEHAVAEALLEAPTADAAFPRVLAAIGEGLGWRHGGGLLPDGGGALRCVVTWTADAALEPFAVASQALVLDPGEGPAGGVGGAGGGGGG